MRILISPNAFKGTMSAQKAGEIISAFIHSNFGTVETQIYPIADGGDGTCQLLTNTLNLKYIACWSLNVYGLPVSSYFGWDSNSFKAYIDISAVSGLGALAGEDLNPRLASTYGTGIIIQEALALGAKEIVLGLGGSATIDLGIGILAAIGLEFLDDKGRTLTLFSPDYLKRIKHIQRTPRIPQVNFVCLCDVKNQLFGNTGAIPVFGPQKGVLQKEFSEYENRLYQLIKMIYKKSKKTFVDKEGYGAAGGVAAGLSAFFSTELEIGSSYFFDQIDLDSKLSWAELVITGEGRYDSQSKAGKASYELLLRAKKQGRKVALITSGKEGITDGFDLVISLPDLDFCSKNLSQLAEENLNSALNSSLKSDFWS
jgi:glycerate kinase